MNRIQIYVFWRASRAFLLTLAVLIGVVWLTQALQQLDLMTSKGQTLILFLKITWLVLPKFVAFIAPVAILIAAIYTLSSLNNDSELVIMTNSGAAPFSVMKPLLILAMLVAVADSSIGHYFSPHAQREVRAFFTEINSDLISSVIKPGEFASINEGITFYVGSRDGNGIFNDVFVADNRDPEQSLTYLAKLGAITRTTEGTFFVLQNGTIHRRPKERGSISIIDYSSYAFDLSTFERAVPEELKYKKPSENYTPYLMKLDPENSVFVRSPGKFSAELHSRFANPLYSLAYVFVVFFFIGRAQTTRQGRGLAILSAFLCVLMIRGLGVAAQSVAEGAALVNIVQYLLPVGTMAVFGALIAYNVQPRGIERLAHLTERFGVLVMRMLRQPVQGSGSA
ncbi:MAG: LPS export ABC transporter permease LptF [Rhizobiales bacterium]|nr:LPS export ABC transporter permease LptF [Hyphomicrobiales bacterium]